MRDFATEREALDYLAARICDEAQREGVPLSETERKMLYFSETDWTLPDMAVVSADFDREYDQDAYEEKIAGLVSKITAHGHAQDRDEQETWDAAVRKLAEGDRYISVLVDASLSAGKGPRPAHDILKLWLTAVGIVAAALTSMGMLSWMLGPRFWDDQNWLSFRRFGGLLVLAPVISLIAIAIRRGWIVISDRK